MSPRKMLTQTFSKPPTGYPFSNAEFPAFKHVLSLGKGLYDWVNSFKDKS